VQRSGSDSVAEQTRPSSENKQRGSWSMDRAKLGDWVRSGLGESSGHGNSEQKQRQEPGARLASMGGRGSRLPMSRE
jgi:hypothetical protein